MLISTSFASHYKNNPAKKGQLAARKHLFGGCSRYAVAPVHTRFDAVEWFVWDAENQWIDSNGRAGVIRQASTLEEAIKGLD
jgi:hypothetical protein